MKLVYKLMVYCLIAVTVVQSVLLLIITITWAKKRSDSNEPNTSRLCTDCGDLVPYYDKNGIANQVAKLRSSPGSQCCGGTGDILGLAAQKETKDMFYSCIRYMVTDAVYQLCDSYVDQTPYVQAVGITGTKHAGGLYQLLWNENGETLTKPSIQHITHSQDEGEIFIRRAGLYKVSSRLALQAIANLRGVFSHYIYVLSHKYGSRRMMAERRMSLLDMNQTYSMINAVFSLHLHDRLSVAITNPEHICLHSNNNVFSVHFVGSN